MNQASAYFGGKNLPQNVPPPLDVRWTIDGKDLSNNNPPANSPNLLDLGWHLLTLEVVNESVPLSTPIPLQGLQSQFYPAPTDNKGESIQIVDINCKSAQFAKNGDTCSSYIKVSYDYIKAGITNPPTMYAQFAPINYRNLPIVYDLDVKPLLDRSQGDYRVVLPIENMGGSTVIANRNQYQILQMQNIAIQPLTIKTISNLTNPNFTLMHRTSKESSDQYYGNEQECSLVANPGLNQINQLESVDNTCILIYQAELSATQALESDTVSLATDASMTAPWALVSNTFTLIANYTSGQPIPEADKFGANFTIASGRAHPEGADMVMDSPGDLISGTVGPFNYPFNLVNVSYQLAPKAINPAPNQPLFDGSGFNIAENCTPSPSGDICTLPVQSGQQILTDGSNTNPVTVGIGLENLTPGSATANPGAIISSDCGQGAKTLGNVTLLSDIPRAKRHVIHLIAGGSAPANCGSPVYGNVDIDVPLDGSFQKTLFNEDVQGCTFSTNGHWDIGGSASVTGSCNAQNCTYTLNITSHYGNIDGTRCDKSNQTTVQVNTPYVYEYAGRLSNYTPSNSPTYASLGGQNLSAWFGGQGSVVAQTVECSHDGKHLCNINGIYRNGLSATAMAYQAGFLNAGDRLKEGFVNFNRSEGYDLSDFTYSR